MRKKKIRYTSRLGKTTGCFISLLALACISIGITLPFTIYKWNKITNQAKEYVSKYDTSISEKQFWEEVNVYQLKNNVWLWLLIGFGGTSTLGVFLFSIIALWRKKDKDYPIYGDIYK